MAKLHFKYGAMNSGKSSVLIMIAHNYENQGKKVCIMKPSIDLKGNDFVISRINGGEFKRKIDFYIYEDTVSIYEILQDIPDVILIDEAQFLTKENVFDLVSIVTKQNIPVICFGLRSDFKGNPFIGSSYLFSLAQDIEEIGVRSICECGSRATMNVRYINGSPVFDGKQVAIDGYVEYKTKCLKCFEEMKCK